MDNGWKTVDDELNGHVTEMLWTGSRRRGGVGRMAIAIAIMLASEAQRLRGKLHVQTDFHYYNLRSLPNTNLTNLELPSSRLPTQPSSSSSAPPSSPSLSSVPFPRSFCACGATHEAASSTTCSNHATAQQLPRSFSIPALTTTTSLAGLGRRPPQTMPPPPLRPGGDALSCPELVCLRQPCDLL